MVNRSEHCQKMEDLRAAAPPQLIRGLVLALPFELLLWWLLVWVGWLALS